MNIEEEIEKTLSKKLKERIVHHKKQFIRLFRARYLELLPSLIHYKDHETVAVDFLKVEVALRNNYDVVIGLTKDKTIQVIGYAKGKQTTGNPVDLWSSQSLDEKDIKFLIPPPLRQTNYKEITYDDNCQTGNFIVLRNKVLNYVSDYEIINHYVDELAEIVLSRFSISMQVKISTIFLGAENDETLTQLVESLYNGDPAILMSELFDPDDQIYQINNEGLAQNFQELKREYQNKISELNNMIGMNSLAVEKSSGVSDEEAKSNRAYTTSNANIYLDGRNNGLDKLNKRYNLTLEAMYDDDVVSEFNEIVNEEKIEEGENNEFDDHHAL